MTRQTIVAYEGETAGSVPAAYLTLVCEATGVSPSWLLFGREPMMDQPESSELQRLQLVRAIVEVSAIVPDATVSEWTEVVAAMRSRQRVEEGREAREGGRSADTG